MAMRLIVCTIVGMPILYGALAFGGLDDRLLVIVGVFMFLIAYTVLDVISYPTRPIPHAWLRRRITTNLVYLAAVALLSLAVSRLLA